LAERAVRMVCVRRAARRKGCLQRPWLSSVAHPWPLPNGFLEPMVIA